MRWDIFCKVIDNHGDLGVCWRLACALAAEGDDIRLWIDDATALAWMAPQGCPGVAVLPWRDNDAAAPPGPTADVLIEAFGCDPAPAPLAQFAQAGGTRRAWINLEYLSAEPYVARLHGLPSPVFRGPGEGLTKHFFYPGFTPATGGLLREAELPARQAAFDRAAWLAAQGIAWQGEQLASLFCYEPAGLAPLLAQWRSGPPTRLLATPGRATAVLRALLPDAPTDRPAVLDALQIHWLPHLPQLEFDHLLWACDLNFVRGEDSLVRALWAGAPFVWQIYPQDDDAHHVKLGAFLDWLQAPASLREFHHAWNGFSAAAPRLPDAKELAGWRAAAVAARAQLMTQEPLQTRLRGFVAQKS